MIGLAKQEGSWVKVYDEKGHFLCSLSGELRGFTSTTVAVQQGSWVRVYDEKGHFLYSE